MTDKYIYHITTPLAWNIARKTGCYEGDTLHTEGFIHASTIKQVVKTANRFYSGKRGLLLLKIEANRLKAPLKYEAADGSWFPHIYGPLNIEAVLEVLSFEPKMDGYFELPARLQHDFLDSFLP